MNDIETEIVDVIATAGRLDSVHVKRDAELRDLGLESLDIAEIVFTLEERFGIEIAFNANDRAADGGLGFRTIGDVIEVVAKLIAEQAATARAGDAPVFLSAFSSARA